MSVVLVYIINSVISIVSYFFMITREVGSKLLTPGSATNQRLMSPAMATKKAEKLAPQLPRGILQEDVRQVHGIQQPEHRHAEAVVEYHADNRRNQVPVIMGGGGRSTTSPQESDNNRQAQSKKWCCTTSSWESDNVRQAQSKQRGVITSPQESDNYRQAQSKQRGVTTSPQESDNHRQAQTKQRGVTTSPQESDNYRQAQSKQKGATTDPQPEANGTKKATEGESALYNQHTACSNNQVSFSTLTDVMLPSQSWTDAITMPHNEKWVRVRDPGPKEGGARHYAARHYPYQQEEGRRHCRSPSQQNTPPQGPYMVGPPEPNTEASQKQTYFASEQVHRYKTKKLCKVPRQDFVRIYKPKTFTSEVKVVPLTYFEELLIRNRAMCLILCYRHILYFVVFSKTAPFFRLKSIVFGPNYYVTTANRSAVYLLFS